MQQYQEIAHFLRNLVRDDRKRGHDAEVMVGEERRGDQHAVHEVVERVADDDHGAAAPVIVRAR